MLGVDAADRAYVACDEGRSLVARPPRDDDVRRGVAEDAVEVRGAAGDVHRPRRARRPRRSLARLRHCLVRHATRVDDLDLTAFGDLVMPVREQPLTNRLRVGERDLASEEARRERRHAEPMRLDARRPDSDCAPSMAR